MSALRRTKQTPQTRAPLPAHRERGWGEGQSRRTAILTLAFSIGTLLFGLNSEAAFAASTPAAPTCTTAPRAPSEILALLDQSDLATPAATTGGATLPSGTPASEGDQALIAFTVAAWLACQNAGEQLRAWSLFSDGYLYRLLSRETGLSEASLTRLATPTPSSAVAAEIDTIANARLLPDGRLGAMVTISYASIPMPKHFFFYFVRDGDGLMIDSILGEISFSVP